MGLNETRMGALADALAKELDPTAVKRGWKLYKAGCVKQLSMQQAGVIYASVEDEGELQSVILDYEDLPFSSCTCSKQSECEHMAALFFAYCQQDEKGASQAEQFYFRLLGVKTATVTVQKLRQSKGAMSDKPEPPVTSGEWRLWIEKHHGEAWKRCRHSLTELQPIWLSLQQAAATMGQPLAELCQMTSLLFILDQAEKALGSVDSFSRYYHQISFSRTADPYLVELHDLIEKQDFSEFDTEELAWAADLAAMFKKRALRLEKQLFDWAKLYYDMNVKLSGHAKWYDHELKELCKAAAATAEGHPSRTFLYLAMGMMYVQAGEDEQAIAAFAEAEFEKSQQVIYACLHQRMGEAQPERIKPWIDFLFERIYALRSGRTVGPFLSVCRKGTRTHRDLLDWVGYMRKLLPFSYYELSAHLMEEGDVQLWTELQLLLGVRLEDIDAQQLKAAAKLAPEALLPLYHQTIEGWIQSRNRQGYRMAVKQLKKLERIYDSRGDSASWERYLHHLLFKYQRLRALQEELAKGKMV